MDDRENMVRGAMAFEKLVNRIDRRRRLLKGWKKVQDDQFISYIKDFNGVKAELRIRGTFVGFSYDDQVALDQIRNDCDPGGKWLSGSNFKAPWGYAQEAHDERGVDDDKRIQSVQIKEDAYQSTPKRLASMAFDLLVSAKRVLG